MCGILIPLVTAPWGGRAALRPITLGMQEGVLAPARRRRPRGRPSLRRDENLCGTGRGSFKAEREARSSTTQRQRQGLPAGSRSPQWSPHAQGMQKGGHPLPARRAAQRKRYQHAAYIPVENSYFWWRDQSSAACRECRPGCRLRSPPSHPQLSARFQPLEGQRGSSGRV